MLDAALSALGTLLTPYHMGMLMVGVMVGPGGILHQQ